MEQISEYVTFGEIQEQKQKWFESHGTGISFKDAVGAVINDGKTHTGIPVKPDFLLWDLESMQQFKKLTYQIPISVNEIRSVENHTNNHVVYLKTVNEVQIGLESIYAEDILYSIDYFTIIYVLSGHGVLNLSGQKIVMGKGELCILPPLVPYYLQAGPDDYVINISSNKIHFEDEFRPLLFHDNPVSAFFRKSLFDGGKEPLFFMLPVTKDLKSIIQHLFMEYVKKDLYSQPTFYSYLQIFYTNIIRSSQSTHDYYLNKKEVNARTLIPAILEFISNNYHTASMEDIAAEFHYESTYFSRFIKKYTGKNYVDIVTDLKMHEAKTLLSETKHSISTIAKMCGYNSADHFTYTFKKINSCSPREYRNRYSNQ